MALTRPRYSQIYDTDWKQSVRLATTTDVGNLFLANVQPSTVDSVSLSVNDRILVKDQTRPFENGIYIVRSVGSGSNGWWTRTLDAAQSGFVTSGLSVVVSEGTINNGREYRLTTPDPITLDTTNLSFTLVAAQPAGANTYVQFNDMNIMSGSPGFTFNKAGNSVNISGNVTAAAGSFSNLTIGGFINTIGNVSTAALTAGQINTTGNVLAANVNSGYFIGSGQLLTSLPGYAYSNVNVKAYTESMGFQNYGNSNVTAYTVSMGFTNFSNVNVAAYTQTQSYTNYSNINLAAYLGGAVTVGGNLTVQGNLIVLGNLTTLNVETINTTEYISSTGNLVINNSAPSTSTTTGVIVALGGIGLGGNLNLGGNIVAGGNVTAPYYFGNGSQLSGVITSVTKIINGNATIQAYPSGNISVTPGGIANTVVFATQPIGTTTNAAVFFSSDINFTGNLYQNGNLFTSGGIIPAFYTVNSNDFGLITDAITLYEDEGNLLSAASATYDLSQVATVGPVFPGTLALPLANTMPVAVQVGQIVYDTANNAPRFSPNAQTFNDPIGYTYVIDDFSNQFDGITTKFILTVNGGSVYAVNNPAQVMLNIGGINVMPFRRSYYDYQNLPELYSFTSGFVLNAGTTVGNLNLGSGNTIVFSTAPPRGAGVYGTIRTNSDPQPRLNYNQTPFSAINIMLGS